MKKTPILVCLLISFVFSAQNLTKINSDFNLSDTLNNKTEIRIYQGGGITNYSSLFRMFKNESEKWQAEFYEHYAKVGSDTELRTEKRKLKSKNDMEFVFQNFIRSHILDLPDMVQIQWKMVARGHVEKIKRKHRGKTIEKYDFKNRQIAILDGEGFIVQAKAWNKTNEFEFSNPDSYLKHYPDIDELIYMCEILDTIRNEFGIWKK